MDKTYRRYDPEQLLLLPPALQDWLSEDHVVYFRTGDGTGRGTFLTN